MSGEQTQKNGIAPIILLELAVPVISLGSAFLAILVSNSGSTLDIRYFAIGCVIGSLILAYLAWIRPHKDIVALSTPIYSFLFFVLPSDVAVTIFLEVLYAVSLTILLIRLKIRFGPAPESGRVAENVLEGPVKSYCETIREQVYGTDAPVAHYAAIAYARFAQGDFQKAADVADAALVSLGRTGTSTLLKTSFGILREHALILETSGSRPDPFLEFSASDTCFLAKPLLSADTINERFESSLDNALLFLYATAWNASEEDRPLLLVGQGFARRLMSA
jgi:hypothetical protein